MCHSAPCLVAFCESAGVLLSLRETCVLEIHCMNVSEILSDNIVSWRDSGQKVLSDFSLTEVLFSERMGYTPQYRRHVFPYLL